uniref:Uncharacterized protein n=1 Tax=Helianthus annuus TaxID=4232 RepID=A0A251T1P4_HELAN
MLINQGVITVYWNKSWTRHQKGLQKWLPLPRFKCFNSRSPLPFLIDLKPITHVRALLD